eukprot:gene4550-8571_t
MAGCSCHSVYKRPGWLSIIVFTTTVMSLHQAVAKDVWTNPLDTCSASEPACSTTSLALRRRVWTPPEPVGPHESMYTKASISITPPTALHVIVRSPNSYDSDAWNDFLDSLQVQSIIPTIIDANAKFCSDEVRGLISQLADRPDDVIIFLTSPEETIFLAEATELTRKFNAQQAEILFPASLRCQLGCSLDVPEVPVGCGRYFGSSGFIGRVRAVKTLIDSFPNLSSVPSMSERDQLVALYMENRDFYGNSLWHCFTTGMKLDTNFSVFQPLFGYTDDWPTEVFHIKYTFHGEEDTRLLNKFTEEYPGIILADGNVKLLTQINNYMPL